MRLWRRGAGGATAAAAGRTEIKKEISALQGSLKSTRRNIAQISSFCPNEEITKQIIYLGHGRTGIQKLCRGDSDLANTANFILKVN